MLNTLSKRRLKKSFESWFEETNLETILEYNLELLPVRMDIDLNCFDFDLANDLTHLSKDCLLNLLSFKGGVLLLCQQVELLIDKDILHHLFSSPFMDEESLLILLMDQRVIDSGGEMYLEHLARNPNIYE